MTKTNRTGIVALATLAVMAIATLLPMATPAQASSKGRLNTTYGLGAVTAYGLLRHNHGLATVGAVGTGVAYYRYRMARKEDHRREREYYRLHHTHKRFYRRYRRSRRY